MRARAVLAVFALSLGALVPSGALAFQQPLGAEATYWQAVDRYASGSFTEAVRQFEALTPSQIETVVVSSEKLAKAARCRPCAASDRFDALPLKSALLLHAYVERQRMGSALVKGQSDCEMGRHPLAIRRILVILGETGKNTVFVQQAALAIAMLMRSVLCPDQTRQWADLGLKFNDKNAVLHLVRGMAHESMGALQTGPILANILPSSISLIDGTARARYSEERFKLARADFQRAIALVSDLSEAHLRLGRVEWRLGRLPEARAALEHAVATGRSGALFLAHTFLGQVLEDQDRVDDAIDHYRQAIAIEPRAQTGAIALAQALAGRGAMDEARSVLDGVIPATQTAGRVDPFWTYLIGTPSFAEGLFSLLGTGGAQ